MSAAAALWGASAWAVLQVQNLRLESGHGICGAWGCGPPVPVLAACHGFWLVALTLPVAVVCRRLDPHRLHVTGWGLLAAGGLALLAIAAWDALNWWPAATEWQRQFLGQRLLFAMTVQVDLPAAQLALAGLACLGAALVRCRSAERITGRTTPAEPTAADHARDHSPDNHNARLTHGGR